MPRLDPRISLALMILSIAAVVVTRRPLVLAGIFLILMAVVMLIRTDRPFRRMLSLFGSMLGFVFCIGLIFYDLPTSMTLVLRLLDLLIISFVFFHAVDPDDLSGALQKMGVPFKFTFILSTSMRYVPLIGRKIGSIRDAQQSRGIDLRPRPGNLLNLAALLGPLVVQSFILADDLALAMESRGFASKHRRSCRSYRIRAWEYLLILGMVAVLIGLILWERG